MLIAKQLKLPECDRRAFLMIKVEFWMMIPGSAEKETEIGGIRLVIQTLYELHGVSMLRLNEFIMLLIKIFQSKILYFDVSTTV